MIGFPYIYPLPFFISNGLLNCLTSAGTIGTAYTCEVFIGVDCVTFDICGLQSLFIFIFDWDIGFVCFTSCMLWIFEWLYGLKFCRCTWDCWRILYIGGWGFKRGFSIRDVVSGGATCGSVFALFKRYCFSHLISQYW